MDTAAAAPATTAAKSIPPASDAATAAGSSASIAATTPTPIFEMIALDTIALSPTPMQKLRRERFNKETLAELAISIKAHGVLQPVLVRPYTGTKLKHAKYELVAGERRFSAAREAGLQTLPAMVRSLTDLQVVEMQVVENNQREDLHELIEAEGFEQLINVHKLTVDAIAAKIGKSKSHVYGRLKYCALCPEVRKAFYDGKIGATLALEIARHITPHDLQRQALEEVTELDWQNEPMNFRRAAEHIRHNYLVKLSAAPFDIKNETLVAAAGSCLKCPKSSGNQPELFADSASANVCTDPKCFATKREAHAEVVRVEALRKGRTVIAGAEAKKIAPHGAEYGLTGYTRVDQQHWTGSKHVKIKDVLGKDVSTALLQDPKTGDLVPVVSNDQLKKALAASGIHGADTRQGAAGHQESAARRREEEKRKLEKAFRLRLFREIHAKWRGGLQRTDLERLADMIDDTASFDQDTEKLIDELIPQPANHRKSSADDLARYIVLLDAADHISPYGKADRLLELATRFKIDAKAMRATVEKEAKSAETSKTAPTKAAPKTKQTKSSTAKSTKTPKAKPSSPTKLAKKKAAKK